MGKSLRPEMLLSDLHVTSTTRMIAIISVLLIEKDCELFNRKRLVCQNRLQLLLRLLRHL